MSAADAAEPQELIVAPDGSILAEQLARLGLRPGAHLRVVPEPAQQHPSLRGSLPDFPALSWDDFERGSQLAPSDLNPR